MTAEDWGLPGYMSPPNAPFDVAHDDCPTPDDALALSDVCSGHLALRPPQRMTVTEGAISALILKRPGDAATPWSVDDTPYMSEPMNMLASRAHQAVCFVGPAQSGKTAALGEGWMSHIVTNDPGDMLMVQMTEAKAREYSKQRIYRALQNSPKLRELLSVSMRDQNTHDIVFRHGMWLRIAWPTVTNLSSTSYRYVFITDLDRMPDDLDGEGDPFTLGTKRTTTFLSRGMTAVESSPGRPQIDPNWRARTPHEAPPTGGILGIYNRSDRRRWYWKCLDCREWFEASPGLDLFNLPSDEILLAEVRSADLSALARHHARVVCPHCASLIDYKYRHELNQRGRWLQDGCSLTQDNETLGSPMQSTIAGYWLGGVAAAYQSWESLLNKHFQGLRDYALTGSEVALQVAVNTDQAMPYMSRHLVDAQMAASNPEDRVEDDLQRYVVPPETRCVVVAVDVQGGVTSRFVVQAHAVGPHREQWLIDRYEIKTSTRQEGNELCQINPASHTEDWDVLTDRIIRSTYRTPDAGREIRIKMLVVDTGGEDGTTDNAYAWFRRIRKEGYAGRVMLYKGAATRNAPIIKESLVGKRHGREVGDVPLYLCNPNLLSDIVSSGLKRVDDGAGAIHFPAWLGASFFDELQAEVRSVSGIWTQIRKRNESFDLCRMICAGILRLGLDKIRDWNAVPPWLAPLQDNSEVIDAEERRAIKANARVPGQAPAPAPVHRARRVAPSPYL
jgi:phage terminase large subunit GpA-like protein